MTQTLSTSQIRELFLSYFEAHGHTRVDSSSLIPGDDPTLLFNNAGMNQFKDCFLGIDKRDYTRATSSQKCVRAGGKHNDLDNVGYTARHHTFFEMLGNFSFGDYFKLEGIQFVWGFLTGSEWLGLDPEKLYVTVYQDDDEAFEIWRDQIGLPEARIIRIGDKGARYESDNFWAMGDTGPCGPCTEVFYDHGDHIPGGLPGTPEEDGDRFIEIWNCVFMQYNRHKDGTLEPLPAPSVDTGMGLERITAVMQHVGSNYEIDLFVALIDAASKLTGFEDKTHPSLKVIADHIRAVSFLINDGVTPGNEGRGYVLRRIIRRAVRHGNKLGAPNNVFSAMVAPLAEQMGDAYPQLKTNQAQIAQVIEREEIQFAKTLDQGLKLLEADLQTLKNGDTLSGEAAFKLYDTYGFPVDLTADIARERGVTVDEAGFEAAMNEQRARARAASSFDTDYNELVKVESATEFTGYDQSASSAQITHLYTDGKPTDVLDEGTQGLLVMDSTPFYAEGGGQAGEAGTITTSSGVFEVLDTQKSGGAFVHRGVVKVGRIEVGDALAQVDPSLRAASAKNHSATHLLHAALREVLGASVTQKGSLVTSEFLRFDFASSSAVSADQLMLIEKKVNEQILANTEARVGVMSFDEAIDVGALALFGEKYGDQVRVLSMGLPRGDGHAFSVELCGGLHVERTGDIGQLKITSESAVAAGIRRIEAVTGLGALKVSQANQQVVSNLGTRFKASSAEIIPRIESELDQKKILLKKLERLEQKLASLEAKNLVEQLQKIAGFEVLIAKTGADAQILRGLGDDLSSKLPEALIVLIGVSEVDQKVALLAVSPKELQKILPAGNLIKHMAEHLDGRGGGKPASAQGGAPFDQSKLDQLMQALPGFIEDKIKG